jgi:hypothetical protein
MLIVSEQLLSQLAYSFTINSSATSLLAYTIAKRQNAIELLLQPALEEFIEQALAHRFIQLRPEQLFQSHNHQPFP